MSVSASINDSIAAIRTLFDLEAPVAMAADLLRETLLSGRKDLVCGNRGSASESAHLATELACRFVADRRPYPAISLTGDEALMTAIGNDYSFAELFARQIKACGLADVELLVPQEITARIQEAHKVIIHLLCELVEPDLAAQ